MRQIQVCAWLWTAALALVACSGGEFSTGRETSAAGAGFPPALSGGDETDSGSSSGGSRNLNGGGQNQAGQSSSGGAPGPAGASSGGASDGGTADTPPGSGGVAASEECASGSAIIRMLPGRELPKDYLCDVSCGTGWLTITDAEGATAFSISAACGTASCDTCEVQTCGAAACLPTALHAEGTELEWNGTYLAKDTCGKNMACQRQACVKPGKYKARACATLNDGETEYGCVPQEAQLCAEVEFEFPAKDPVVLVLEK